MGVEASATAELNRTAAIATAPTFRRNLDSLKRSGHLTDPESDDARSLMVNFELTGSPAPGDYLPAAEPPPALAARALLLRFPDFVLRVELVPARLMPNLRLASVRAPAPATLA